MNNLKKPIVTIFEVERYCQEQGITIGQYEKQCFWADRDWGNYPEPERHNPDKKH